MLIITLLYSVTYVEMLPMIKSYGKMELARFNQMIVTHSYMTNESIYDDFVHISRNDHQQIQLIEFDMIQINQLANDIVLDIEALYAAIENHNYIKKDDSYYEERIDEVSQNGVIAQISLSALMNMPMFYYLLPFVNVQFRHLSKVNSSVKKSIQNYGLNHIVIEIVIQITMEHTIVYPFFEEITKNVVDIPVLLEIYQGQVPLVYRSE